MKKTVLFAAALFAVSAASAQTGEITSNRGENWLSQDGDWGLTFDAAPLLNYAGNLFNGHQGNGGVALNNIIASRGAAGINGNMVVIGGKKLIDANTAYRGQVRLGFGSHKETVLVNDVTSTTTPPAQVEDVTKNGFMGIDLGVGIEKRVGSTRVVGVYGAMFDIGFGSNKTTYEYGNALTATNPGTRTTEMKGGSTMGLGLRAFAGVEWFCAPKVSLSGEYTWGVAMSSTGHNSTTTESFVNNSVTTTTVDGGTKVNNFSIDTGVSGASIGVNFYFQ
ncbi:MAG: hypothetical protein KBH07_11060 [Flavobacteriales bacterium]|nr:hypothetical protein [Flavobacteriales bacterium]MBP9080535.1 hypothetical protein [Flavobacteriales bacterium]